MAEIQVRNVSKEFLDASGKPFRALRDISFTWVKGENISFTGESGSGKSTMARLLIGLERPTSGEILLDGENIAKWSYGQWRSHRTKIQAVFQDATGSLNRRLSVGHNLEEALRNLTKLSSGERKQRILELMDLTATSRKLLDTPTKNLSGGEQRRVALLRALAVRPDYLILDELTSGLDLISQKAIREVLEAYHREYQCSYFLITHDILFYANIASSSLSVNILDCFSKLLTHSRNASLFTVFNAVSLYTSVITQCSCWIRSTAESCA